jgi:hypothetical protein
MALRAETVLSRRINPGFMVQVLQHQLTQQS